MSHDDVVREQLARVTAETWDDALPSALVYGLSDEKGGVFTREAPGISLVVMPGLSDYATRIYLRELAERTKAFLVVLTREVWVGSAPAEDLVGTALVEAAHAAGEIDKLPPKYRSEAVHLHIESDVEPIRMWKATINDARRAGPLEELKLTLPRPTFRRYLPEASARRGAA